MRKSACRLARLEELDRQDDPGHSSHMVTADTAPHGRTGSATLFSDAKEDEPSAKETVLLTLRKVR